MVDRRTANSVSQIVHEHTSQSLFMNVCFTHLGENVSNAGHVFKKKAVILYTWP